MSSPGPQRERTIVWDILAILLREARNKPGESPSRHLATALGEAFYPSPVVVELPDEHLAYRWDPSSLETRQAPKNEATSAIESLGARPQLPVGHLLFQAFRDPAGGPGCALRVLRNGSQELRDTEGRCDVVFTPSTETLGAELEAWNERFEEFLRSISDLRMLFDAFTSLHSARQVDRLAQRLGRIDSKNAQSYEIVLKEATGLLNDLKTWASYDRPEAIQSLTKQLLELVILELLGRGWDVGHRESREGGEPVKIFAGNCRDFLDSDDRSNQGLVATLEAMGGAPPDASTLSSDQSAPELAWSLLTAWTSVHRIASEALLRDIRSPDDTEPALRDLDICDKSRLPLARMLELTRASNTCLQPEPSPGPASQSSPLAALRADAARPFRAAWMRLWFCWKLLEEIHGDEERRKKYCEGPPTRERWRLMADLAYVLRESLRALMYESHSRYSFQPAVFSNALESLVEFHALDIVEISEDLDLKNSSRASGESV